MDTLRKLLLAILAIAFAEECHPAHVAFNLRDFIEQSALLSRRTLVIEPRYTVSGNATNIITSERRSYNAGTNAIVTVSNMVSGLYLCSVWGTTRTSLFRIYVPATSDLTNAAQILVGSGPGLLQDNGRYIFADP